MADLLIKPLTGAGNTVTIQDQAGGAILTSGNSGATLGSGVTIDSGVTFPAGMMLNIQQVTYTSSYVNGTSNVWQDWPGDIGSGVLNITPKSTSSKFYVTWSLFVSRLAGTYSCHARLSRKIGSGSWNDLIAVGDTDGIRTRGTFAVRTIFLTANGEPYEPPRTGSFLDSPTLSNTTDPVYYRFIYNNAPTVSNSTETFFNRNSSDWNDTGSGSRMISTLTMMEIAG